MKRIVLTIALLFTLALLVHGLMLFHQPETAPVMVDDESNPPDAIAINARSVSYGDEGQISWRLRADEIWYWRNPEHSEFQQPRAEVYLKDEPAPWRLRAEYGTLQDEDQVHLHQDVVIMTRSPKAIVDRMETEFLQVDLTLQTMRSDQPVQLLGPGLHIEANGIYAEMESEKIHLTNGVRSVYEP